MIAVLTENNTSDKWLRVQKAQVAEKTKGKDKCAL